MKKVKQMIGWQERLMLTSPLWVSKTSIMLLNELNSIKPVKWEGLQMKPPRTLAFTIAEFCNAACTFCCHRFSKPTNYMSNDIFFKSAREYYEAGGRRIWLNAMTGESLLDPNFFEKTAFLRSLGHFESIDLQTNGILLRNDQIVDSIINSGITTLHISTAGFEKEMYERYMGVKKYDQFMSGVDRLLSRNQMRGNPLPIQFQIRGTLEAVDTEDFALKIQPFMDASAGRISISFLRLYHDWGGQIREEDLPKNCGIRLRSHIRARPCSNTFNLGVLANGDMRLCNCNYGEDGRVDDLRIGNIMEGRLMDIWRSAVTSQVRRTSYKPNLNSICEKCRMYTSVTSH